MSKVSPVTILYLFICILILTVIVIFAQDLTTTDYILICIALAIMANAWRD